MGTTGAVLVCLVWCSVVKADFSNVESNQNGNFSDSRSFSSDELQVPRGIHRLQLLFPLLLGISGRLATLVPTALMGLFGIFLFVAFSKKAFIISLLALFLSYLDRYKHRNQEQKVVHVLRLKDAPPQEPVEEPSQEDEHFHYHWPSRKPFNELRRNIVPFKRNRKPSQRISYQVPYPYGPTHVTPLAPYHYYNFPRPDRRHVPEQPFNDTIPTDFQDFVKHNGVEEENIS